MEQLRTEVQDIQNKIYELQQKTEHLSNGQRYAAINEIEKNINPLRTDLKLLEKELDRQDDFDKKIEQRFNIVLDQINALEDIKSDLNAKILTENEHIRKDMNDNLLTYMTNELTPLKKSVEQNRKEISDLNTDLQNFKDEYTSKQLEKELEDAKKYDKIKLILTGMVAVLTAGAGLVVFLKPAFNLLLQIFF